MAGVWARYFPEIPVRDLQRGDIALIEADGQDRDPALSCVSALCFSNRLWVIAPGHTDELRTLPLHFAVRAWRVQS